MSTNDILHHARVLVVGGGAREHALVWKLAQSPLQPILFAAPGNAGIAGIAKCVPVNGDDVDQIVRVAQEHRIDLVVVGPEVPLAAGLVDRCTAVGIRAFGPSAAAARIESSKAYAKELMETAGIKTAAHQVFTAAAAAKTYVESVGAPVVIKADGLAAGKGVVVATTVEEATRAVDDMLVSAKFGASGQSVVVEQFLAGREVSQMFFVDAKTVIPMVSARDYKRVGDGNCGGNTGGMGAFAPVPGFREDGLLQVVEDTIVRPLLAALKREGIVYRGVLYAGLMMTEDGLSVIEFNCRFGDPETQVVLPLLDTDLLQVLWAITADRLAEVVVEWKDERAVCVVLAAPGYPEQAVTGQTITIEGALSGAVFHAGTSRDGDDLVTAGGRVMAVLGTGPDFVAARSVAYASADAIYFEGKHFRSDIAND